MSDEKYVDESWKEQASDEKEKLTDVAMQKQESSDGSQTGTSNQATSKPEETKVDTEQIPEVEINFLNYVTSLGFQAMIFMGEIPNPVTNEVEKNLTQAKFLIDTLAMLKEKTIGNLSDQEKNLLESSIYELQLRYVQIVEKETSSEGGKTA